MIVNDLASFQTNVLHCLKSESFLAVSEVSSNFVFSSNDILFFYKCIEMLLVEVNMDGLYFLD